ncbi:bifunctional P-loop containing nucleoside triphosphate hydrolase/Mini-chromosome maintenance protein/Mini-chromosome maintenance [Babesia duncani]|uniref:DNA helicase n=1 Tax=Babesia duncani TaxID=323732 RepID=A0AAD9PJH9_9APIC|nr:bifunctional P-loop containing nucleoside triphosphate hydrolase/Mini-chromosome maintenance protein/Mini-chromosome maintenance [Babesia duncani]
MSSTDDIISSLCYLYFTVEQEKELSFCMQLLDSWREFFFNHWDQFLIPYEYQFFETLVLPLDYQKLLDYNVPPSVEQFKRDIYSNPSFTLSCMALAIHIETINNLHGNTRAPTIGSRPTDSLDVCQKFHPVFGNLLTPEHKSEQWSRDICKCIAKDNIEYILQRGGLWRYIYLNETRNHRVHVSLENFGPVLPYNSLRSYSVECLVCIQGQVIRLGLKKPLVLSALFTCVRCSCCFFKKFDDGRFEHPSKCLNVMCQSRLFNIQRHFVDTTSIQRIRLQRENLGDLYNDTTNMDTASNNFVNVELTGGLVDKCKPGNVIRVVGIVRAAPSADEEDLSGQKSTFNIYIHAVSVNVVNSKNMKSNASSVDSQWEQNCIERRRYVSNEIYAKFASCVSSTANADEDFGCIIQDTSTCDTWAPESAPYAFIRDIYYNEPNRFYLAAASLCSRVVGRHYIRAGILLSLLGGIPIYKQNNQLRRRGNIHCLLVGDPGVGKSLMLRSICTLMSGATFFSGGCVSSSGLTAAVIREKGSSEYCLEAGALVLSSGGICCIDELDKTTTSQQHAFLEAMEQQSVSIAKGGIVCTLNAQCTVICAANPVGGKFRFDLLFLLVYVYLILSNRSDNVTDNHDKNITDRILNSTGAHASPNTTPIQSRLASAHYSQSTLTDDPLDTMAVKMSRFQSSHLLSEDLLKSYVEYAKTYITPTFTKEARVELQSFYCKLRTLSKEHGDVLPITTRQLEGIIRMCQARARGDLMDEITVDHVRDVCEIFKHTAHYPGYLSTFVKTVQSSVSSFMQEAKQSKGKSTQADVPINVLVDMVREHVDSSGSACISNQVILEGYH